VNGTTDQPLPTKPELIRATAIALVASIVLLVTTILPAEYGVDPLGVGGVLGLDKLSVPSANAAEIVPDAKSISLDGMALSRADTILKRDTLTVVVPAYEGIELKARMKAGQPLVFDWRTDGEPLYTDMHGERLNAAENEFTSYWKEAEQNAGRGTLVAQFEGTHGWYWQNMSDNAVTVTVDVSGFYQDIHEKK
jgi:hypothetical protein